MGGKLKVRCPVCKKRVSWENNPYRPFCSQECKLADFYHWINEDYRIKISRENLLDDKELHFGEIDN